MPFFLKIPTFRFVAHLNKKLYSNFSNPNLIDIKNMPKEPKHIAETQKQRIKIKQRNSKYVPGKVSLQILGTGAKGAPRALYLFSDQARYLFNCGEGTQRLAHEHKMKLGKLEHIFVTQSVWKNIGGLPGAALTIQDVGVPEITLHGPLGLKEIFVATRRFVVLKDLKIKMAKCDENSSFEDNVMTVKYVPLFRKHEKDEFANMENNGNENNKNVQVSAEQVIASTSTRSEKKRKQRRRSSSSSSTSEEMMQDETDYYAHEHSGQRITPDNVSVDSQNLLREAKEVGMCMAYVCRLQPRPGALSLDKCVRLGVPPGPLLGKLKNGEDVELPNGNVVKSSDVCEPDDPGPVFIVIDCPTEDYLDCLVNNETLKKHQRFAQVDEDTACLVVHFTPMKVMDYPQYQKWLNDFPPSTQHISVNEANTCMGSLAVHRIQHKLHLLSEEIFPILKDNGSRLSDSMCCNNYLTKKIKSEQEELENNHDIKSNCDSYASINTLCQYHLRPKKGLDRSLEVKIEPEEYISETMDLENFPDALKELQQKMNMYKKKLNIREYPKILFLGTGSCIPNKTRNTSGILLQTDANQHILLDCGEGTYGQIIRFFGPIQGEKTLANINAIYVSHLHADHHIGVIGVLQGRRRALQNLNINKGPLHLFAPKQILTWLSFYDNYFESIRNEYVLVPNGDILLNNNLCTESRKLELLRSLGLSDIYTCGVIHCPNAFGVAITHKNGFKITYSGDTMPCESLIELGKDSDLLIHEATMEDELAHEAVIKMHSTTSQAIEVGRLMGAKHIILTHFSQRYAKLPRFNDNFADNISIAFDNMQIKLDELPLMPLLYPALRIMFAEHYEELEHKAVKRQLKSQRIREASLNREIKQN